MDLADHDALTYILDKRREDPIDWDGLVAAAQEKRRWQPGKALLTFVRCAHLYKFGSEPYMVMLITAFCEETKIRIPLRRRTTSLRAHIILKVDEMIAKEMLPVLMYSTQEIEQYLWHLLICMKDI